MVVESCASELASDKSVNLHVPSFMAFIRPYKSTVITPYGYTVHLIYLSVTDLKSDDVLSSKPLYSKGSKTLLVPIYKMIGLFLIQGICAFTGTTTESV
jgi:hypothetical protein